MPNFIVNRQVRKAELADIPAIIEILNQNLIANKPQNDPQKLESTGFLVHEFSAEELQAAILDELNHLVLVSTEADKIVGYVLSYDLHYHQPEWIKAAKLSLEVSRIVAEEKVLYHRHIAKKLDSQGVGAQLLFALFSEAAKRHYPYIICTIARAPLRNVASANLHENLDFMVVGEFLDEETQRAYDVYLKRL